MYVSVTESVPLRPELPARCSLDRHRGPADRRLQEGHRPHQWCETSSVLCFDLCTLSMLVHVRPYELPAWSLPPGHPVILSCFWILMNNHLVQNTRSKSRSTKTKLRDWLCCFFFCHRKSTVSSRTASSTRPSQTLQISSTPNSADRSQMKWEAHQFYFLSRKLLLLCCFGWHIPFVYSLQDTWNVFCFSLAALVQREKCERPTQLHYNGSGTRDHTGQDQRSQLQRGTVTSCDSRAPNDFPPEVNDDLLFVSLLQVKYRESWHTLRAQGYKLSMQDIPFQAAKSSTGIASDVRDKPCATHQNIQWKYPAKENEKNMIPQQTTTF